MALMSNKLTTISFPACQLPPEAYKHLNKYRNHEAKLPYDVYEEGSDEIYIIRIMGKWNKRGGHTEDDYKNCPKSLQDLTDFAEENSIDLIYIDAADRYAWPSDGAAVYLDMVRDDRFPIYISSPNNENGLKAISPFEAAKLKHKVFADSIDWNIDDDENVPDIVEIPDKIIENAVHEYLSTTYKMPLNSFSLKIGI